MTPTPSAQCADALFASSLDRHRRETDTRFLYLLLMQWVFAITVAVVVSPYAGAGSVKDVNEHVWVAIFLGAAINALPIALVRLRPGAMLTRHVVTAAQMLWSAVFVHLTGGRIETNFHVFASLAFVAFYRDWRLLPVSVYGIANPEWWRFLEHAVWVVFENIVLIHSCINGVRDMRAMAEREASLQDINAKIEREVQEKTAELQSSLDRFRVLVESTQAVPWEVACPAFTVSYIAPRTWLQHRLRCEFDRRMRRRSHSEQCPDGPVYRLLGVASLRP